MKLKKLLMLGLSLVAILTAFALVSCDGTNPPEDTSTSQKPTEPEKKDEIKVTLHYGVKGWDSSKTEGQATQYEFEDLELTFSTNSKGQATFEVKNSDLPSNFVWEYDDGDFRGLKFDGWSISGKISADTDAYALYSMREEYEYTFANNNGDVIFTGKAWVGTNLLEISPDKNGAVVYYDESQGAGYSEYTVGDKTYYMADEDLALIQNKTQTSPMAVPIGWYYTTWTAQNGASITSLNKDGTVFTAQLEEADGVIKYVTGTEATALKNDMLDKNNYGKVTANVFKAVVSSYKDGVAKDTEYAVLNKYDAMAIENPDLYANGLAAATADGKAAEYTAELGVYNEASGYLSADFYMAWDGEFIYFLADIKDRIVATHGYKYASSLDNPYENDCVELWYAVNNNYSKISLDACGFSVFSNAAAGEKGSAYLDYIKQKELAKAKINGAATPDKTQLEPTVVSGATGYTVAFAFPAYNEPDLDKIGDFDYNRKEDWGAKLNRGDTFFFALQINNISGVASMTTVDKAILDDRSINDTAALVESDAVARISRVCFGYQMSGAGKREHAYRYVLG